MATLTGILAVPAAAVLLGGISLAANAGLMKFVGWIGDADHDRNDIIHHLSCHALRFRSWGGHVGHYRSPFDATNPHSIDSYKLGHRCVTCGLTSWGGERPDYDPNLHGGLQAEKYEYLPPSG